MSSRRGREAGAAHSSDLASMTALARGQVEYMELGVLLLRGRSLAAPHADLTALYCIASVTRSGQQLLVDPRPVPE